MSTHREGANTHQATCRDCGQHLEPGQGIVFSVWGYPWDGSDGEGSITAELERYTLCLYRGPCVERIVAQGTNLAALRTVAQDYENFGDLATQARRILAEYRQLAIDQARAEELAAREDGYGAIGSGVS